MPARGATKGLPSFYNARVDHPSPRAVAVVLLAAMAWLLAPSKPFGGDDCAFGEATYQEAGESLIHAFEPGPRPSAYHLPLAAGLSACLRGHSSEGARAAWRRAAGAVVPVSASLVGTLAGGPAAGLAAGALSAWAQPEPPCHPQAALAFFVALAAGALVLWSRRPSAARAASVAAAVGASLALRSTLAFLPPLAALWSWARGARRGALVLALAPWAFPAVWAACNNALHGRAAPFEMGQASSNLVVGALGFVGTVEGDVGELAPEAPDVLDTGATARWATREALAHPRRTLDAVVGRLVFAFRTSPLLWTAALMGLWAARRRPEARALALVVGGFTAAHAAMAVQENYFLPLAPLLAAVATAPLWARRARLGLALDGPAGVLAVGVLAVGIGIGVGGAAWAAGLGLRNVWLARDRAPGGAAALATARAENPDDPVVGFLVGRRDLVEHSTPLVPAFLFNQAARAGIDRARPLAGWSRLMVGEEFWSTLPTSVTIPMDFTDTRGLTCAERALSGMFQAEAAALSRRPEAATLARAAVDVRRSCSGARSDAAPALSSEAAGLRALLAELAAVRPRYRLLLAPRLLSPSDAPAWRALAIGLQDLGDSDGALEAYGHVGSGAADVLADKAVALALSGRTAEAKALLEEGLRADPGLASAALTLGALLEGEGKPEAARAVYERALAAGGGRLRPELERRLRL